jgi:hypothetical protein
MRHSVFVVMTAILLLTGCMSYDYWNEEILLHDGSRLKVVRTVKEHLGNGELSEAFRKRPDQYGISFREPKTGKKIEWEGERHIRPLMVEISGGEIYLAAVADNTYSNLVEYGCPELPYVYLRFNGKGGWGIMSGSSIPPKILLGNISPEYAPHVATKGGLIAADVIPHLWNGIVFSTGGFIQRELPVTWEQWKYPGKNSYKYRPRRYGCTYNVPSTDDPSHIQWPTQPAAVVTLERLSDEVFDPIWIWKGSREGNDFGLYMSDDARKKACDDVVKLVGDDAEDPRLRGWFIFKKDETRKKKARNTYTQMCDESSIWFFSGDAPGYLYITRFTHSGELLYRVRFARPVEDQQFPGGTRRSTIRSEGGYVYFEWWHTQQSGYDRLIQKRSAYRFKEPG